MKIKNALLSFIAKSQGKSFIFHDDACRLLEYKLLLDNAFDFHITLWIGVLVSKCIMLPQDSMAEVRKNRFESKFLNPMFIQPKGVAFRYGVIDDTNQGNIDLDTLTRRLDDGDENPVLDKIITSGMWHVVGFPFSVEATEMVVKYVRNYNPETRRVEKHSRVYADFSTKDIISTFNLPIGNKVVRVDLKELDNQYNNKKK